MGVRPLQQRFLWFSALVFAMTLGAGAARGTGEIDFGRYHALVIGNNAYQQLPKLETAVNDAESMAELLEAKYGFEVTRRLHAMSVRHIMVIADSCYSGTLVREGRSRLPIGAERQAWLGRITQKRSRTAIVSGGLEPVADTGRSGHSVFANALLTPLDENAEVLEGQELFRRISRPVVVNADQTPQHSDIKRAGHEGIACMGKMIVGPIYTGVSCVHRRIFYPTIVAREMTHDGAA